MGESTRLVLGIVAICALHCAVGFVSPLQHNAPANHGKTKKASVTTTALHLLPVRTFLLETPAWDGAIDRYGKYTDANGTVFDLCLVEEDDLPDVAWFLVQTFGTDTVRLSQDNVNAIERFLMEPAIELVNGYSALIAFAEVLAGLRSRLSNRLHGGDIGLHAPRMRADWIRIASSSALVLVLARVYPTSDATTGSSSRHSIEVIGTVELRLEPCDAKIPFSLPWLDRLERLVASLLGWVTRSSYQTRDQLQPYLSNLCVHDAYRKQGIGQALLRCVEYLARTEWGYSRLYLHVDPDNKPALELYKSHGYKDVGRRWKPFWAGEAASIGYFSKAL